MEYYIFGIYIFQKNLLSVIFCAGHCSSDLFMNKGDKISALMEFTSSCEVDMVNKINKRSSAKKKKSVERDMKYLGRSGS